ncbi:peptidylprolyl isomerase [bacterium]|nr:peptidylprolyl isomerase [bacterium]MBU1063261.1 peptidylprolyl isomerase [bacterium]MBU1633054.1 peptidylprolyl isomerase [bacterium]MBU1873980.1 peptidylprolyl isomerase [bacterium]
MQIAKDMVVAMHYTLTLDSGDVIDSSTDREPLQFIYGHGMIIPGLEKELSALKIGDKKSVTIQPEEGYGLVNEQLTQTVSREQLPSDLELKQGMSLTGCNEKGRQFEVNVKSFTDSDVVIDMNHPLAGKVLTFETEIVEIREASSEELDHGHVH